MVTNTFTTAQAAHILQTLGAHQIAPLVYALIDGAEKFSYQKQQISTPMKEFLCTRRGDCRDNPMNDERTLLSGQTFYFTCIDDAAKLYPACEVLKKDYRCLYQKDIYTVRSGWKSCH